MAGKLVPVPFCLTWDASNKQLVLRNSHLPGWAFLETVLQCGDFLPNPSFLFSLRRCQTLKCGLVTYSCSSPLSSIGVSFIVELVWYCLDVYFLKDLKWYSQAPFRGLAERNSKPICIPLECKNTRLRICSDCTMKANEKTLSLHLYYSAFIVKRIWPMI